MLSRVRPLITVKLMDASRLLSFHLITKFADPLLHNDTSKEGRQEDSAVYETFNLPPTPCDNMIYRQSILVTPRYLLLLIHIDVNTLSDIIATNFSDLKMVPMMLQARDG